MRAYYFAAHFLIRIIGRSLVALLLAVFAAAQAQGAELLPPGFRPVPPGVHALVGAKVFVKPAESIEGATIVIRDGFIEAVGKDVKAPADARVWDMKGTVIYAGFIDAFPGLGTTNAPVNTSDSEPITAATMTSPGVKFFGAPGAKTDMGNPGPGYEIAKISPEYRAVLDYSPKDKTLAPLREIGFTAAVVAPAKGVVRGTSALVALADENPNKAVIKPDVFQHIGFETHDSDERAYPGSLMGVIASIRQAFIDTQFYTQNHADYEKHPQGRERPGFDPSLEALKPVLEKKQLVAIEPGSALMVDRAARLAKEFSFDYCIVSPGQEWRRADLAQAVPAKFIVPLELPELPKLPSDDDWDQITLDQLRSWDWAAENPGLLRKQGHEIALTTHGLDDVKKFRPNLRAVMDRNLSETDALTALTTVPAALCGVADKLGTIEPGKYANLTITDDKGYFDPEGKVREVWIDGRIYRAPADGKDSKEKKTADAKEKDNDKSADAKSNDKKDKEKSDKKKQETRDLKKKLVARSPQESRGPIAEPKAVLIKGATVWTCGPQGRLTNADVLVVDGKIKSVGAGLSLPADAGTNGVTIDAQGMHVTPGIIDCHSHTAILGAVNESTLPSTAMVRIHDVVNSETENIYQQLAGGVTAANLLHGSANPIGGQNCVIKMRFGAAPEDLVFAAAPPGIKFALGENVKQSNWGDKFTTRFPQTRMGVRTFIGNRFTAAQEYLAKATNGTPLHRDLELETIGEIIQGKRYIHCHSYRQDEILMLIRLMETFGVHIKTFQHVLEGYKVADEIAAHGAGGSTFSDWWAYKFEVYDAIPYNGSLMTDRGVVVSFNSDSSELARRLYAETAKAVKYGGTPELEAFKFVTLNPAKQLGVDKFVGSLEPGKDADFAIWNKSPMDSTTMCQQTWVDGKKYFDRSLNAARVAKLKEERDALLAKAKQLKKLSGGGGDDSDDGGSSSAQAAFFRVSLEHQFDGQERHCLDEE